MLTDNITNSRNATMLAYNELHPLIKGNILVQGDSGYDSARKIWNGMIDRNPAIIVQCIATDDIQQAVNVARKYDMLVSVRGGGHNVSGNAVCDGGIMIDLSLMKKIRVEQDEKLAHVEMGATWGDFDKATHQYGLGTTGGLIWDALQSHLSRRVYVNTMGIESEDRVREAYGDNYQRLAQLKHKYDPNNFFRMNQNIAPAKNIDY